MDDRDPPHTEPAPPPDEPADDIFAHFVAHANREWVASVEALLADSGDTGRFEESAEPSTDPERDALPHAARPPSQDPRRAAQTGTPVLLTRRKTLPPSGDDETTVRKSRAELTRSRREGLPREAETLVTRAPAQPDVSPIVQRTPEEWASVVRPKSHETQKREAVRVVPDVSSVAPPEAPPQEGVEDGQMPSGEMDRKLGDMAVLLRYGHGDQVQAELETLRMQFPDDLLLLRRIAELYVASELRGPALDALFKLAGELFERRNVEGMRQAVEQARVLDPTNTRAARLLSLLDQRPDRD